MEVFKNFPSQVPYSELNCHFPSNLLPTFRCPDRCGCNWNRHGATVRLNCSGQALTRFPAFIPRLDDSTTVLHLENNRIANLSRAVEHFYTAKDANYSSIEELYLSGNRISAFSQECLPPREDKAFELWR